jgi:hypothetical protein
LEVRAGWVVRTDRADCEGRKEDGGGCAAGAGRHNRGAGRCRGSPLKMAGRARRACFLFGELYSSERCEQSKGHPSSGDSRGAVAPGWEGGNGR